MNKSTIGIVGFLLSFGLACGNSGGGDTISEFEFRTLLNAQIEARMATLYHSVPSEYAVVQMEHTERTLEWLAETAREDESRKNHYMILGRVVGFRARLEEKMGHSAEAKRLFRRSMVDFEKAGMEMSLESLNLYYDHLEKQNAFIMKAYTTTDNE